VPCSASAISHHMHALHAAQLIQRAGSEPVRNSVKHYFSSLVGDKSLVLGVLQDTEQSDNHFLAHASVR